MFFDIINKILEFKRKREEARFQSGLQKLHEKREKQASQAVDNVQNGKDLREVDQLAYMAEFDIRDGISFEKREQLRQKLADILSEKVKNLIDPIKTCTNLDEMKNYRNLIRRTKEHFLSYTIKQVIEKQLEEAKKSNADMIIAKMEESTDYAEIHNLYDIIDLYLSDKVPHVDIEDYIMIGPEHFVVNLGPDREEINKKLNRCVNEKVDLFLTIIEKHEESYSDSSMYSLLYRMKCVLDYKKRDIFFNTLLKIINNLFNQMKKQPENSWYIHQKINTLKCHLPADKKDKVELNMLQVLKEVATILIQRINNESDILVINGLSSAADRSMSYLQPEEREELAESLNKALNDKINLVTTGDLCADIDEIDKIRNIYDNTRLTRSQSLGYAIRCQLEKVSANINDIIDKMQESTSIDEIIKLYSIIEMYIRSITFNGSFLDESKSSKEELNEKLNECLNSKADIILEEIKKRDDLVSLNSLLYRLKDNLDDEGRTKLNAILIEKINELINRIKIPNGNWTFEDWNILTKIDRIKLYISDELIEEIESNIEEILQSKESQSEDSSVSRGEKPKVLELKQNKTI